MRKKNKLLVPRGVRCLFLLLALLLAVTTTPLIGISAEQPAKIKLKLALFHPSRATVSITYKKWEKKFKEATHGRVLLKIYDSGTLVKGPEFVDAVHRGIADLALSFPPYIGKTTPLGDISALPGLITSDKHGWDVCYGGLFKLLEAEYAEHGWHNVKCLHPFLCNMGYIYTKDKQIKVPDDLKGLKIRDTGAGAEYIKRCGGAPVFMRLGEVYEGIQRGIVDGARGSPGNIFDYKWYELKPMYGLSKPIMWAHLVLIANKNSLAKIPKDLKSLVDTFLYSMVLDESANRLKLDSYYRQDFLPAQGLTWYTPTPEEAALWEANAKSVIDAWLKRAGPRGQEALNIIKKYR